MGRWMEVVRELAPETGYDAQHRPAPILDEVAPHPLMTATGYLPRNARTLFPMLERVRIDSGAYGNKEELRLDKHDAIQLVAELRRFRKICRNQEFIKDVKGDLLAEYWRADQSEMEFDKWVDRIEGLLELAIREDCWVILSI